MGEMIISCQVLVVPQNEEEIRGRVVRTTDDGGITWTPQNENNAERRESEWSASRFGCFTPCAYWMG
jgi:hypothetical protein